MLVTYKMPMESALTPLQMMASYLIAESTKFEASRTCVSRRVASLRQPEPGGAMCDFHTRSTCFTARRDKSQPTYSSTHSAAATLNRIVPLRSPFHDFLRLLRENFLCGRQPTRRLWVCASLVNGPCMLPNHRRVVYAIIDLEIVRGKAQ